MARRNTSQIAYQAIRIKGALIPADELARLTALQTPVETEQTDTHYGVPKGLKLRDEIARYWKIAQNLKPWADELTTYDTRSATKRGQPFVWKPERRAQLRAERDAYYARLYGLTRNELRYILDPTEVMGSDYPSETFRVLKEGEVRAFGEYRTRRLVLEAWDQIAVRPVPCTP